LLPGEPLSAGLEQLVTPAVEERLRDRVLTTDLPDASVAAQPGQHDLELLLRRERPVLPLLAQPSSPFGRAAHPEPGAGQSVRRYAPTGLPGAPTQLPVNAGPGSGAPRARLPNTRRGQVPVGGVARVFMLRRVLRGPFCCCL